MTAERLDTKAGALSEVERDKIRHALGLKRSEKPYRNAFAAGPDDVPVWEGLRERGLAELSRADGEFPVYRVSADGRALFKEG